MLRLKILLEDAFAEQVQTVYNDSLREKGYHSPESFDRDALQLGVIYEMPNYDDFSWALAQAMLNLEHNPHFYDDVVDAGKREADLAATNQITWTGHPGVPRLR